MFGWICPKCGGVYSPFVSACRFCVGYVPIVSGTSSAFCTCGTTAAECPVHPRPKTTIFCMPNQGAQP